MREASFCPGAGKTRRRKETPGECGAPKRPGDAGELRRRCGGSLPCSSGAEVWGVSLLLGLGEKGAAGRETPDDSAPAKGRADRGDLKSGAAGFAVCGFRKRLAGRGRLADSGLTRRSGRGRTSAIPIPADNENPAADGVGAGWNGKDLGGCARGGEACATFRSIRSGSGDPRGLRRRSGRPCRLRPSCWRCPS